MKKILYLVILSVVLIISTPISVLAFSSSVLSAPRNEIRLASIPKSTIVSPDKVWTIEFSKNVDQKSVKKNITLWKYNKKSNKWSKFNIKPTVFGKKVLINHTSLYPDGQYQIRVSKNIRSVNKENLSEDFVFNFTVETM